MVWATFSAKVKFPICFAPNHMVAQIYVELLDSKLVTFAKEYHGDNWVLQQGNAPIHIARHIKGFFGSRDFLLLLLAGIFNCLILKIL